MYEKLKLEDELDCVKVKFFNLEKSIDDDKATNKVIWRL